MQEDAHDDDDNMKKSPTLTCSISDSPPGAVSASSSFATLSDDSIAFMDSYSPTSTHLQEQIEAEAQAKFEEKLQPACYADDSHLFLSQLQFRFFAHNKLASQQLPTTRATLVEWIIRQAERLTASSESIFLCVALMDRVFLTESDIPKDKHRLFALACLVLATKFEEIMPPSMDSVLDLHNDYTFAALVQMENWVLLRLKFSVLTATPKPFMRRMQHLLSGFETKLTEYLAELTLADLAFQCFTPSIVAAGVVFSAVTWTAQQQGVMRAVWTNELQTLSGYAAHELLAVNQLLWKAFRTAQNKKTAVFSKYENTLHSVSTATFDRVKHAKPTSKSIVEGGK